MNTQAEGSSDTSSALNLQRVLLVDDDAVLCEAVQLYLERNCYQVAVCHHGDEALKVAQLFKPDLVVLDVMLPGKDGFQLCRSFRDNHKHTRILMLTAREEDFDHLLGLELGADDYLVKPVHPRMLLAHIKAILRRTAEQEERFSQGGGNDVLKFGRLAIYGGSREVFYAGERIAFTAAEFDLLWILASRAGTVVPRKELLKELRGLHSKGPDRSIDARLYRVRRRFGLPQDAARKIKTVRPHGYLFSPDDW